MFFRLFTLIFLFFTINCFAAKLGTNWIINKDHSEILFEIPYLKFGKVTGRFNQFRGQIKFDSDETLIEKINLVIFTESISTGNALRDGHLKSNDFFDVKNNPKINFQSTKIIPIAPSKFSAIGIIELNNVKKELTINFQLGELIKDTWGQPSILGQFEGELDRRDFNLNWNKFIEKDEFLVGNNIRFYGQMQLQSTRAQTDSSKHLIPVNQTLKERNKILRGEQTKDIINHEILSTEEIQKTNIHTSTIKNDIEIGHSTLWWIAYFSMGLIGFISIINLMFQGKQYFIEFFKTEYEETGKWGMISDILVYSIGLIYVWAMWIVGFQN